ncbi:MAG: thiamine phosphate synthase [Acidimicrobiales bacterium]
MTDVTGVALPRLMVLTDRRMAATAGFDLAGVVAAAVDGADGAVAVVLREKDLPRPDRYGLATRLRAITASAGASLIVAGDVALARQVGADGVHVAADASGATRQDFGVHPWRNPTQMNAEPQRTLWVGRSCHTTPELVAGAEGWIADYATFSPVFTTASKPGYGPELGIDGLAAGCRAVAGADPPLVVYALGGIVPGRAAACRAAGAAGVAVMGAVMRADDPGAVVRALCDELAQPSGVPGVGISVQETPEPWRADG